MASSIFIFRPVAPEDLPVIEDLQNTLIQQQPGFRPKEDPHITYVSSGKIALAKRLQHLVYEPLPSTAIEPTTLATDKVPQERLKFFRPTILKTAVVLSLNSDTPGSAFNAERKLFNDRINRHVHQLFPFTQDPHITLGYIEPHTATDGWLQTIPEAPKAITFGPIDCLPPIANPKIHKLPAPLPVIDMQPRIVQPGTIPSAFLNSLRKNH